MRKIIDVLLAVVISTIALGFLSIGIAQAAPPTIPFPPQVAFISNGKYEGTLQTQGMTLPITGILDYLAGIPQFLHISVDTGGQQISSDSWTTSTVIPAVINEWEIVSTDPTTCRKEVLSGHSYPQCTAWNRTPSGSWSLECTVTVQGNKGTLDISAILNAQNQLVQLQENSNISGMADSLTINMTEQGTTPPAPSDFDLPGICSAPNRSVQGENDNSQGNDNSQSECTGTIPSICL